MSSAETANAAERAHAEVRSQILDGRLAPGSMLSESTVAAGLSMSRTPVRAALVRLQDEGLVTIYPKRGALVRELTADEMRESAQVRHALESAGVRLALDTKRSVIGTRLEENLVRQTAALRGGDFAAFAQLSLEFHRAFVELADNSVMLLVYDRLRDRQYLTIMRNARGARVHPDRVLDEHRELMAAAKAGDWVAFSTLLHAHQQHGGGIE